MNSGNSSQRRKIEVSYFCYILYAACYNFNAKLSYDLLIPNKITSIYLYLYTIYLYSITEKFKTSRDSYALNSIV